MFAHKHLALDFGDNTVRKTCEELEAWRILQGEDEESVEPSPEQMRVMTRNQFNLSVVLIGSRIHLDALGKKEKRKKQ